MIANVIVFSYNRPRMLGEAIDSVLNSTHKDLRCVVFDDGSDTFDVEALINEYDDDRVGLAMVPKMPVEERVKMGSTQWSENLNAVLEAVMERDEFITYLCDDDILAPDWLNVCNERFNNLQNYHTIIGDMYYFYDGQDPFTESEKGFATQIEIDRKNSESESLLIWWSVGAFANLTNCFYDEDVRWGMGHLNHAHSWDVGYIEKLQKSHPSYLLAPEPAVYRREHSNTLSAKLGRLDENGLYVKAGGELQIEHILGNME